MKLTPGVPVNLGPDTSICNGGTLVINAPVGYASYTWQDGSTNSSYSATKPGNYMVTVSNACGVISSDEMMLFLKLKPLISSKLKSLYTKILKTLKNISIQELTLVFNVMK